MNSCPKDQVGVRDLARGLEERLPAALRFLEGLVSTNSFTRHPAGVNENARLIAQRFCSLGFSASEVACEQAETGRHLVLDSRGEGPVIACISHLDTVYSSEEEARQDFAWRVKGNRAFGPGTYDIKGGTALLWMMLDTLAALDPEGFRAVRWVLLWNAAEEILASDFGPLCRTALPPDTRACLVFEGDTRSENGFSAVRARKGSGKFRLRVSGRGAHAGVRHQEGANAIHQIARLIDRASLLTDYGRNTTVNVGTVQGGVVVNRVPHEAEAVLEIRSFDQEHYQAVRRKILEFAGPGDVAAASDGFPCRIEVEQLREVPPWTRNAATDRLMEVWQRSAEACGYSCDATERGGLSDANRIWSFFPTIDGLGPRGGNAHTSERSPDGRKLPEYVDLDSFVPKALINCTAVQELISRDHVFA